MYYSMNCNIVIFLRTTGLIRRAIYFVLRIYQLILSTTFFNFWNDNNNPSGCYRHGENLEDFFFFLERQRRKRSQEKVTLSFNPYKIPEETLESGPINTMWKQYKYLSYLTTPPLYPARAEGLVNRIMAILRKKSTRRHTTVWWRWSTGNYARDWNLILLANGTCTNQNPSWRMRHAKFSGILRYK